MTTSSLSNTIQTEEVDLCYSGLTKDVEFNNMDYVSMLSTVFCIDSFLSCSPSQPDLTTLNTGSQGGVGICCHY